MHCLHGKINEKDRGISPLSYFYSAAFIMLSIKMP